MIDEIVLEDVQRIANDVRLDCLREKRVLVSGGAGFIGSYVCDVLVEIGARVACLDNFSTGLIKNIDHLIEQRKLKLVKDDVSGFESEERYDYILHLASRASPEEYQLHPRETLLANSLGSYRMLELARKHGLRILFASSSEVYGEAKVIPTPENYWGNVNPVGVRSCYDEGKRFGEALFMAYHREHGLDTRIVRIFNTYGPRLKDDGRVLTRLTIQALRNEDLTVYGDGSQTRSFCYITDTVLGILLALSNKKTKGEIFNIGNSFETSILDLAKTVKRMVGCKSRITFRPLPEDDPKRRCPDITKARKILGWAPKIALRQGLRNTINWFRRDTSV